MNTTSTWWLNQNTVEHPPQVVLPEITIRGQFFALANGEHWTAIQCSDFNLFTRFILEEDIGSILLMRQLAGFNLLRVWTLFDIPQIGTLLECDYDQIPAFVSLCARYGLYVEFCAYTGINDPHHWNNLCQAALNCQPRPLLELVNELDVNTNEPDSEGRVFHLENYSQAPSPLLSSHGSNGSEQLAVRPPWSYETFHTNGASEWQRKNGHNAMEMSDGTPEWTGSHVPILTNEATRCADRDDSQEHYYDAAAGAALLCAGSCFHSVHGKTSDEWISNELKCALAHASGARSVQITYQDGRYERLSPGNYLRRYQRVLPDGSSEVVEIRK